MNINISLISKILKRNQPEKKLLILQTKVIANLIKVEAEKLNKIKIHLIKQMILKQQMNLTKKVTKMKWIVLKFNSIPNRR